MPDFREYAVVVPKPGDEFAEATQCARDIFARRDEAELRPRKTSEYSDLMRQPRTVSRPFMKSTDKIFMEPLLQTDENLSVDGRVMEILERAHVPGMAGRLFVNRAPWIFLLLRSIHSHRGFDVQSACEMAESDAKDSLAAADRLVELSAHFARVASGSQRV